MSEMSEKNDAIHNNRISVYEMYRCLKDFVVAYDDQIEDQMLSVYHGAIKAIEMHEKAQQSIVGFLGG